MPISFWSTLRPGDHMLRMHRLSRTYDHLSVEKLSPSIRACVVTVAQNNRPKWYDTVPMELFGTHQMNEAYSIEFSSRKVHV